MRELSRLQDLRYNIELHEYTEGYITHLDNKIDDVNDVVAKINEKLEKIKYVF
jgi:hypothetical protein